MYRAQTLTEHKASSRIFKALNTLPDKRAPREQYVSSNCRDKGQSWGTRLQWLPVTTTKGQYQNTDRKERPNCPYNNNWVKVYVRRGTVPQLGFWLAKSITTATIPLHSKQASAPWPSKPQRERGGWGGALPLLSFLRTKCVRWSPLRNERRR